MDKHEELARRTTAWAADAARADSLVKAIQDARVTKKSNLSSLGPTLQANLDASLQAANLKESVKKIELKDPRHVQVSFEAAEFALLVEWITRVHQEMQVQVIEADLSATETAGVVNGTVLLEAPGV
jgi:type II secretory pathway component PulM